MAYYTIARKSTRSIVSRTLSLKAHRAELEKLQASSRPGEYVAMSINKFGDVWSSVGQDIYIWSEKALAAHTKALPVSEKDLIFS